jgi:hypothetical protein
MPRQIAAVALGEGDEAAIEGGVEVGGERL